MLSSSERSLSERSSSRARQRALRRPANRLTRNRTRKITKQIFAIPAAAAAMPPNPKMAAIIATTRNTQAYQSMLFISSGLSSSTFSAKYEFFRVQSRKPLIMNGFRHTTRSVTVCNMQNTWKLFRVQKEIPSSTSPQRPIIRNRCRIASQPHT